jgi:hypothetical protein
MEGLLRTGKFRIGHNNLSPLEDFQTTAGSGDYYGDCPTGMCADTERGRFPDR